MTGRPTRADYIFPIDVYLPLAQVPWIAVSVVGSGNVQKRAGSASRVGNEGRPKAVAIGEKAAGKQIRQGLRLCVEVGRGAGRHCRVVAVLG